MPKCATSRFYLLATVTAIFNAFLHIIQINLLHSSALYTEYSTNVGEKKSTFFRIISYQAKITTPSRVSRINLIRKSGEKERESERKEEALFAIFTLKI